MEELLNELRKDNDNYKILKEIVQKSKDENLLLNKDTFEGILGGYASYIVRISLSPYNYNLMYQIMNDEHMSEYVEYTIQGLKSSGDELIKAVKNSEGEVREFYIELLEKLPIIRFLSTVLSYDDIKFTIELNIYSGDDIAESILKFGIVDDGIIRIIHWLIKDGYVENFMKIYDLAKKHNKGNVIDRLSSYILNQI